MTNTRKREHWLTIALWLSIFTILYNFVEGIVSVYFGAEDNTLALLGFGIDSFVEMISGIGIMHMVIRSRRESVDKHDQFERQALKITGISFYILAIGLTAGVIYHLMIGSEPETTIPGLIISSISIIIMYFLMIGKIKTGRAIKSEAILSDASCTKTCIYLSLILLTSSALYHWAGIPYIDLAGSLGIAWFALREGKEAIGKAKTGNMSCGCDTCHHDS